MQTIGSILPDVKVIESTFVADQRGSFLKIFQSKKTILQGFHTKQVNFVTTKQQHTLRGLHYQSSSFSEAKFFRVISGSVQLGFIDLRSKSSTYLQSGSIVLEHSKTGILIPRGYATGYCTLQNNTQILYLCDNDYHPEAEKGICWHDPILKIEWLVNQPIVSVKDRTWTQWR